MSRICVKNLPKYVVEDRLRDVFSQKGEITDAKLMRSKDGKSRQFAFIGFRTELEAQEAIKYFDKSYLDTCRISCEIACKVGDPNMPRPWSRYSLKKEKKEIEGENNHVGAKRGGKKGIEKGSGNDDPNLQEFLQVMQPRVKSKMWTNDTLIGPTADQQAKVTENKTQAIKGDVEKLVASHVQLSKINLTSDSQATEKSKDAADDKIISDMDYFKSRVKKDWLDSESEDDVDDEMGKENDNNGDPFKEEIDSIRKDSTDSGVEEEDANGEIIDSGNPSPSSKAEQEVSESGRLFVRNLPYTTIEDELREHFSKFGNISEVHIVVDKDTKQSKGIAYVLYSMPESASSVYWEEERELEIR